MPLPASFAKDGFGPIAPRKCRRLMIGTDGPANSGKTEFGLSAPGPGIAICLDRGFDAMLDNQNPPPTRQADWAFSVVAAPIQSSIQGEFLKHWTDYRTNLYKALANPDARTILIDGDSDSWEMQRLAAFGKLTQIPPIMYTEANLTRRQIYMRAWDSGKIIIATNKVKRLYATKYKPDGSPVVGNDGKEVREWDQKTYSRQGFDDQDYLWQIQLRHLYRMGSHGPEWGIRITKCKVDPTMEGYSLWGKECNFAGLVQTVYPSVPLSEWGF